ncbi:MAG: hypothetical protein WBV61_00885, partial [Rhodanobacteraceae bacterium]
MLRRGSQLKKCQKPFRCVRLAYFLELFVMLICAGGLALPAIFGGVRQPSLQNMPLISAAKAQARRPRSAPRSEPVERETEGLSASSVQAPRETEIERESAPQATETDSDQERGTGSDRNLEYQGAGETRDRVSTKGGGSGSHAVRGDDDDGPPRTIVKMLKRLMEPSKPKSPPAHGGQGLPVAANTPRASNEILAVNLTPAGANRAKQLGIKIDNSGHGSNSSHGKITRLIPPPGMDANQARDLMKDGRSGDEFAINQRYKFYQPARKDVYEPPAGSAPARHGVGLSCDGDRCFGRKAIHWHQDIQTCASNLRIGIIDTQVDAQHPAFSNAKIHI